jgi:hypothetical protein
LDKQVFLVVKDVVEKSEIQGSHRIVGRSRNLFQTWFEPDELLTPNRSGTAGLLDI